MSALAELNKQIDDFLKKDYLKVMSIRGTWGTGKTWAWKEQIKTIEGYTPPEKGVMKHYDNGYAYVSLFGLNSVDEVQEKIFCNIDKEKNITKNVGKNILKKIAETASSFGIKQDDINASLNLSGITKTALKLWSDSAINEILVCLDDFERKGEKLLLKDILGYISYLSEEKNCKIVLIFNEDSLSDGDKKVYQEYREKVFDRQFLYEPSVSDTVNIAFKHEAIGSKPYKQKLQEIITEKCEKLQMNNIRIIQKIIHHSLDWMNFGEEEAKVYNTKITIEQYIDFIIPKIVILTYFYENQGKENVPSLDFLKSGCYLFNVDISKLGDDEIKKLEEADEYKKRKEWKTYLINEVEYIMNDKERHETYLDTICFSIIEFLENGYLSSRVKEKILNRISFEKPKFKALVKKCKSLFQDTLAYNQSDYKETVLELYNYLLSSEEIILLDLKDIENALTWIEKLGDKNKINFIIKDIYDKLEKDKEFLLLCTDFVSDYRFWGDEKKIWKQEFKKYIEDRQISFKDTLKNMPFLNFLKEAKQESKEEFERIEVLFEPCYLPVLKSKTTKDIKELLLEYHEGEYIVGRYPSFLREHIPQQFEQAIQEIYNASSDFQKERIGHLISKN